jgi:thioester reductase-like protein
MRIETPQLMEKRLKKASNILLTGGTGFLGSHLFIELIKEGFPVTFLCRPKKDQDVQARVQQIFSWFECEMADFDNLRIIEGDIEQEKFGLLHHQYQNLLDEVDEIIHCASDTCFFERKRKQIEKQTWKPLNMSLNLLMKANVTFPPSKYYILCGQL